MSSIMRTYYSVWVIKSRKKGRIWRKKVLFIQHNALVHTSVIVMAKINELKFKLFPHALYSLNWAFLDYFLFTNLKKWLGGQRVAKNGEVGSAVNGYFEELDSSHYE